MAEMVEVSREEFEALVERVEKLEQQLADTRESTVDANGLDHRDQTVLDALSVGQRYQPRALVKLYTGLTDIANTSTARNRAEALRKRSFFEYDGGELRFLGVTGDE